MVLFGESKTHMMFDVYLKIIRCANQHMIEVSVRFMTRDCLMDDGERLKA